MRLEDRAFYSADYALVPDAIMREAIKAKLSAAALFILSRMLCTVNDAGEMRPVSFAGVRTQSCGTVDKTAFSRATRRMRENGIIEPMMRRREGKDVPDQSNYGHACSYRIAPALWAEVKLMGGGVAGTPKLDYRGVYRSGFTPPVYAKDSYTAVPFASTLTACEYGIRPQAALTLAAMMRNVDWFGRVEWSVDWLAANFGFKRVNVLNSVERLVESGVVTPIVVGEKHEMLRLNDDVWGKVPLNCEKRQAAENGILEHMYINVPFRLR